MKKRFILLTLLLCSCNNYISSSENESLESSSLTSISETSESSIFISSSSQDLESSDEDFSKIIDLDEISVPLYYGNNLFYQYENRDEFQFKIKDESMAIMKDYEIIGLKEGETTLVLGHFGDIQKIKLKVIKENNMENYTFKEASLEGKNIATFGDSVSAFATIGTNKTYTDLFAKAYKMNFLQNYAIGGTTATYMYEGSNIDKEYHNNTNAIDGCRVVKKALDNNELNNLDYAFIAFGHNDQYFQPPISVDGDDVYCIDDSFISCHSFKGSYRYMINVLRKANPNIRIILLNCTYSEYCKDEHRYGDKYSYSDYMQAIREIAIEMECKLIEPWDYMKNYFDANKGNIYYKDVVHLTVKGHETLVEYIKER